MKKRVTFLIPLMLACLALMFGCGHKRIDAHATEQALADSIYARYQIRTERIATPAGIAQLFSHSEFVAPDSVLQQCYLERQADGSDRKICMEPLQFLDIYISVDDTVDHLPCNRKTFDSIAKRFPCCYGGVSATADFLKGEIDFEFGEGQWVHSERYIFTCDHFVRISQQGHAAFETAVYYDAQRIDSMECPVTYY